MRESIKKWQQCSAHQDDVPDEPMFLPQRQGHAYSLYVIES